MTRVNLGIDPAELCDQHLIAEVHELPRVFAYTESPRLVDGPFRLGPGHVLWCARYPGTLADRYRALVEEMRFRGFAVSRPEPRGDGARADADAVALARTILVPRLCEKMAGMKREPRWSCRSPPSWAWVYLEPREHRRGPRAA